MMYRKGNPMKKQPELTAQTRKKLIDTYFELTSKGEKATVGAVTEAAGYNRCTFYRYFTDTEQLLSQVEEEICNAFQSAIRQHSSLTTPAEIIESFTYVYQEYGGYLSVLLGKFGDPNFVSKMKEIIFPIACRRFTEITESRVEAELKIEFTLSAVLAAVTKWYEMEQPISATQLGSIIKDCLHNGVFRKSY